ncbi:hypothetical protein BX600DRAFT_440612 [Xylariales sp. PMI_506]|nr:hypothetical protein BX600DRAFT_440612 [Xylariales sp. PMI_506]
MLDENLPTFVARQSTDNSLSTTIYFTQNGSEPVPEYSYRRPDPSLPQSKNRFALGLSDAHHPDVIFGEVLIEPEWQQPTLSAAEIRAQNGVPPPPVPLIPDAFSILLYNPDQQITVRGEKSTWTGKESWEFEIPEQSFKLPSASKLDQQQDPAADVLTPKSVFRWKRDSKFSKDITCYLTGKAVGKQKSKDPDITVAMFKQGREPALTIYEPNLNRVDVQDRKGLEVALLLGAEVIREIYLFPNRESFNLNGAPQTNKRKNSRPIPGSTSPPTQTPVNNAYTMTGGLSNLPPTANSSAAAHQSTPPHLNAKKEAEIDAETKRLQELVKQEERERAKRDKEEQKRIQKMLEEEEKERKRRDAEVAKETERLRKQFGIQGQDYQASRPALPPRPPANAGYPPHSQPQPQQIPNPWNGVAPPPRPVSAGPSHALSSWWHGPSVVPMVNPQQPPPNMIPPQQPQQASGRRRNGSDSANKIQKKRSVFF